MTKQLQIHVSTRRNTNPQQVSNISILLVEVRPKMWLTPFSANATYTFSVFPKQSITIAQRTIQWQSPRSQVDPIPNFFNLPFSWPPSESAFSIFFFKTFSKLLPDSDRT